MEESVALCGFLLKKNPSGFGWKLRYFRQKGSKLTYHKTEEESSEVLGTISLQQVLSVKEFTDARMLPNLAVAMNTGRTYTLKVKAGVGAEEHRRWLLGLRAAVERCAAASSEEQQQHRRTVTKNYGVSPLQQREQTEQRSQSASEDSAGDDAHVTSESPQLSSSEHSAPNDDDDNDDGDNDGAEDDGDESNNGGEDHESGNADSGTAVAPLENDNGTDDAPAVAEPSDEEAFSGAEAEEQVRVLDPVDRLLAEYAADEKERERSVGADEANSSDLARESANGSYEEDGVREDDAEQSAEFSHDSGAYSASGSEGEYVEESGSVMYGSVMQEEVFTLAVCEVCGHEGDADDVFCDQCGAPRDSAEQSDGSYVEEEEFIEEVWQRDPDGAERLLQRRYLGDTLVEEIVLEEAPAPAAVPPKLPPTPSVSEDEADQEGREQKASGGGSEAGEATAGADSAGHAATPTTSGANRTGGAHAPPSRERMARTSTSARLLGRLRDIGGSVRNRLATARAAPAVEGKGEEEQEVLCQVIAEFPFVARSTTELSFARGDVIDVVSKEQANWWLGVLPGGRRGLFPTNRVLPYDAERAQAEGSILDKLRSAVGGAKARSTLALPSSASSSSASRSMMGWLYKKGDKGMVRVWRKRWFHQLFGKLYYFRDERNTSLDTALGFIDLKDLTNVDVTYEDLQPTFNLITANRVWQLRALNDADLERWISKITPYWSLQEYRKSTAFSKRLSTLPNAQQQEVQQLIAAEDAAGKTVSVVTPTSGDDAPPSATPAASETKPDAVRRARVVTAKYEKKTLGIDMSYFTNEEGESNDNGDKENNNNNDNSNNDGDEDNDGSESDEEVVGNGTKVEEGSGNVSLDKSGLFEAAIAGDKEVVMRLLDSGISIDLQKEGPPVGWSALHFAIAARSKEMVSFLLEQGASLSCVDTRLRSPLYRACGERGERDIVALLLRAGADMFQANDTGDLPIHHACFTSCFPALGALLEHCARHHEEDATLLPRLLNAPGMNGQRPLHYAAAAEASHKLLILLCNKGADCNARNIYGQPPLFSAISSGAIRNAAVLLRKGADVALRDDDGCVAMDVALQCGTRPGVELVLRAEQLRTIVKKEVCAQCRYKKNSDGYTFCRKCGCLSRTAQMVQRLCDLQTAVEDQRLRDAAMRHGEDDSQIASGANDDRRQLHLLEALSEALYRGEHSVVAVVLALYHLGLFWLESSAHQSLLGAYALHAACILCCAAHTGFQFGEVPAQQRQQLKTGRPESSASSDFGFLDQYDFGTQQRKGKVSLSTQAIPSEAFRTLYLSIARSIELHLEMEEVDAALASAVAPIASVPEAVAHVRTLKQRIMQESLGRYAFPGEMQAVESALEWIGGDDANGDGKRSPASVALNE